MVKHGKNRKHPVCGNCSEVEVDYVNPPEHTGEGGKKVGLDSKEKVVKMTVVESYDGNGMAYKCRQCGSVVIEPPIDMMLDEELDKEELEEKLVERIEDRLIDKSEVMQRAHELKDQGMDMSEAMSQAWEEAREDGS